ncbi:MAG: ABC transporter ATP-binding protein [Acidobacteria bacterium]|nr:MAG: ABC transporter ATP-binding protein [Acidobacteriota bacterium]
MMTNVYRRVLTEARPYWPHLILALLIGLLSIPAALLLPLPLKIELDSVLGSHPLPAFLSYVVPPAVQHSIYLPLIPALLFVIFALANQAQTFAAGLLYTSITEKLILHVRAKFLLHVQQLSLSYHDVKGSSDSIYRLQYDINIVVYYLVGNVVPLVTAAFTVVGMCYVTARINVQLMFIAIAISPALLLASYYFQSRVHEPWRESKRLENSAIGVVHETLGALRVVKAFGRERGEQERFIKRSGKGIAARMWVSLAVNIYHAVVAVVIALGTAAALYVGARQVQAGLMTVGGFVMVMAYLAQLYAPLQTITQKIADLQTGFVSAERVFSVLDEPPEVIEKPHAKVLQRAQGSVIFDQVSFGYDSHRSVLKNVSFQIEPGTSVGIVGQTGTGKTTLVSLLVRFYDPQEGRIFLDGVDIRDYKVADLRDQFGFVLQESVLFSATIAENIAYGRPGAAETEIVEAAKAANADAFILKLRDRYKTIVGERGSTLSGGERQRIALARAFLKNAPIIILDEPTSSVDVDTEAAILEATQRLIRGRTALIIAHRSSTLTNCDLIMKVEDGQVYLLRRKPSGVAV